jgi:DNA repair protein RadC
MVRERTVTIARDFVSCAADAAAVAHREIGKRPNEHLIAIMLDGSGKVTSIATLSVGGMHGCAVSARDVLRAALVSHASAFVLSHNHPSGNESPSTEDRIFTAKIHEACALVGVPMLDHVIVTADAARFASVEA